MTRFIRPVDDDERARMKEVINERYSDSIDTICDHIRVIYALGKKVSDTGVQYGILVECLTVMAYAKRMDNKLREYQGGKDVKL